MREQVLGDTRVEVIALSIAAMAIVLIACANLASLLLARASVRRGEYAVRLSLGATRARLARQVLVEALCLSVAGGVLGLAIPALTSTLIERIVPAGLHGLNVSVLDWRLLSFAGVLSIVTGVLFSLGPAVHSAHASTADVLQQHARGNVGGSARRFRDALVVLQVAATLVLLVGAGLMLRTLANLNAIELGFDARQSADDAGGAAADEIRRTGSAPGVLRSRRQRGAIASRCRRRGVRVDAPISGHWQHALLRRRRTTATPG